MENTATHWGWLAKSFHWIIALMIAVIVPVGFVMTATYQFKITSDQMEAVHVVVSRIHQTMGLVVLILVVARLGWRLKSQAPDLPAGLAAYQKILARINHAVLYGLLFLLPLSGWAALSAYGEAPTYFFWIEGLPNIVPTVPLSDTFGYAFFGAIHRYAVNAGGGLLALHIIAALWHQFVQKDSVLRRMWPLAS